MAPLVVHFIKKLWSSEINMELESSEDMSSFSNQGKLRIYLEYIS